MNETNLRKVKKITFALELAKTDNTEKMRKLCFVFNCGKASRGIFAAEKR